PLGLVALHVLVEFLHAVRDDREVLGGDAVALRAVAVPAEGNAPPTCLACGEDDATTDSSREILLEDAAIHDLTCEMRHRSSSSLTQPQAPSLTQPQAPSLTQPQAPSLTQPRRSWPT